MTDLTGGSRKEIPTREQNAEEVDILNRFTV